MKIWFFILMSPFIFGIFQAWNLRANEDVEDTINKLFGVILFGVIGLLAFWAFYFL